MYGWIFIMFQCRREAAAVWLLLLIHFIDAREQTLLTPSGRSEWSMLEHFLLSFGLCSRLTCTVGLNELWCVRPFSPVHLDWDGFIWVWENRALFWEIWQSSTLVWTYPTKTNISATSVQGCCWHFHYRFLFSINPLVVYQKKWLLFL